MSIYVGDLQFVHNLSKLGISFKLKDILVGGMGNVNKYFCEVSDFKEIFNKFYTVIKIFVKFQILKRYLINFIQ